MGRTEHVIEGHEFENLVEQLKHIMVLWKLVRKIPQLKGISLRIHVHGVAFRDLFIVKEMVLCCDTKKEEGQREQERGRSVPNDCYRHMCIAEENKKNA